MDIYIDMEMDIDMAAQLARRPSESNRARGPAYERPEALS